MELKELLKVVPDNYKTDMYGDDSVELHVRTQLLIKVNMYEEESK